MQIQLTSADVGRTIPVRVGDTVRLLLSDPGTRWEAPTVSPTGLLAPAPAPSPPALGQLAIWSAVKAGKAEVTATGVPDCPAGQACPMYARLFQVTLVIS